MKKFIGILGIIFIIISACNSKTDYSPKAINFDRDACFVCRMGLTDQRFNIQAINEYGEVRWYDDVGCLAEDMKAKEQWEKWKGNNLKIWIGDASKENENSNWIDAEKAYYDYGKDTPMGYGYSAYKEKPNSDSIYTFTETIERIGKGKTMRENFIKQKKMMGKCGEGKCGK